jgi:hypothetical protein
MNVYFAQLLLILTEIWWLKNKVSKSKKLYRLFLLDCMCGLTATSMANTRQAATLKVCYDQWAPMTRGVIKVFNP